MANRTYTKDFNMQKFDPKKAIEQMKANGDWGPDVVITSFELKAYLGVPDPNPKTITAQRGNQLRGAFYKRKGVLSRMAKLEGEYIRWEPTKAVYYFLQPNKVPTYLAAWTKYQVGVIEAHVEDVITHTKSRMNKPAANRASHLLASIAKARGIDY